MLQVIICKEMRDKTDGDIRIIEVRDLDSMTSLSEFDKESGKIDLSCLDGHVGERILVSHFIRENGCTRIDYECERTLTKTGVDENGIQYIQYT